MSEENKVSNEAVVESGTENVTQESAQNEYIAESKKYRKRAQEAESKLAELNKQLEAQENAKLKEKEEFKTLAEKLEAENTSLNDYKQRYESIVEQRKSALLEQLPEDKREHFKDKELDVLEFMVSELGSKTTNEPTARGTVKAKSPIEGWSKMSQGDKKKHWKDIIKSYTNK
jgi:thymidylate synthase